MNLEDVLPGSYKGISCLMTGGTVTGGNKNVIHSYPNSNRQTVENLGQTPRSFPVNILLPSTDYVAKRDALLAALEDGAPGPLVHPFHGRIENVIAGPFTLTEDFTNLGSGTITVTFLISNGPGVPQSAGVTVSSVAKSAEAVCSSAAANFGANHVVTPSYLGSFESAAASVGAASKAFGGTPAPLGEDSALDAGLIMSPAALASSITSKFAQAATTITDAKSSLKYLGSFFGFGSEEARVAPVTAAQLQAADNKELFDSLMNVSALAYAYSAAVQIDYGTVDEVESVSSLIEAQFQRVAIVDGTDTATREALADLRHLALTFLDAAKLTARRVIDVQTTPTTARLLAFRYYGDAAQGEALANLNGGNVSNLTGSVKVLTS